MKNFIVSPYKNRTVGYWIGFAAAVISLVSGILYVAVDGSDRTFSTFSCVFAIVGGILFVAVAFTDFKFAPILPGICYIAAFAKTFLVTLPSLSDVWNGVVFIGGNAYLGLAFTICFFVSAVLCILSNFMKQKKPSETD